MLPIQMYDYRTLVRNATTPTYDQTGTGSLKGYAAVAPITQTDMGLGSIDNAIPGSFYMDPSTAAVLSGVIQVFVNGEWFTLLPMNAINTRQGKFMRFSMSTASFEVNIPDEEPEGEPT